MHESSGPSPTGAPLPSSTPSGAFFVAGGTVPPGSPSYVERAADRELVEALLGGGYCYVLNSRQMGKSSLAVRAVGRLTEAGIRTAFVDLTKIGASGVTEEQWYVGILAEIGRTLGMRQQIVAHLREHAALSPSQRLITFLQEVVAPGAPTVVIVDEVDAVRSLSFSTDAFFAGVRQCWNARSSDPTLGNLTFCLMGAALPGDLIRDVRMTPFNVGRRIELRDFTNDEARAFEQGLAGSAGFVTPSGAEGPHSDPGPQSGERLVDRVLFWTGGHPFLTQTLCAALAAGETNPSPTRGEGAGRVDALVRSRYLDARARETDSNLADVGNRLLGRGDPNVDDEARADTLSLYAKLLKGGIPDDESNLSCARIKMSGVARLEGGQLKIRNRIYGEVFGPAWIRENMPGQELRRQRRAFRRGAIRVGAIAAVGLAVVGSLAEVAVRKADDAQRSERKARLAEAEARRLAQSESVAKLEAQSSADRARKSLVRALAAEAQAQQATAKEREAKLQAQSSAAAAKAAAEVARQARNQAVTMAGKERAANQRAQESAMEARNAEALAKKNEEAAREMLYASNMELTAQMLDHGNGGQMAKYLGLEGKPRKEIEGAAWEQRHFYAVLHEARLLRDKGEELVKVAFTPGGKLISRDLSTRLSVWDPATGRLIVEKQPIEIPNGIGADLSRSGKQACLTLANGDIEVLSTDTLEPVKTIKGDGSPVEFVEMADAPGQMIGWFGTERRLVDLGTGKISEPFQFALGGDYYAQANPTVMADRRLLKIENTELVLWKFDDGGRFHRLWQNQGRSNTIRQVAYSLKGDRIAYADSYGYVQIVDAASGRAVGPAMAHGAMVTSLAFSGDGKRLAAGTSDGVIKVWRTADGSSLSAYRTPYGDLAALALDESGDRVAFGTHDGRIGFYNGDAFEGPHGRLAASEAAVFSIAASPEGKTMATAGFGDTALNVFDSQTGKRTKTLAESSYIGHLAFSPDGRWLADTEYRKQLKIWDRKTWSYREVTLPEVDLWSLAFSPDAQRILVTRGGPAFSNPSRASEALIVDVPSLKVLDPHIKGSGFIHGAAFSPDGKRFAIAWEGGRVAVFDSANFSPIRELAKAQDRVTEAISPLSLVYAPDGKSILVGYMGGDIKVYRFDTREPKTWPAHTGRINAMAFAGDGRTLISASDDHLVRFWRSSDWRSVGEVTYPSAVYSLAYSPKDSAAYVGDADGQVHALRIDLPIPPKPTPAPETPPTSWEGVLQRAKQGHRAILFPMMWAYQPYDRVLRSLLLNRQALEILDRRFVLFAPWPSLWVVHGGRTDTATNFFHELLGKDAISPTIWILDGDGKVRFDGTWLEGGKRTPMRMPQTSGAIDAFLQALRANAKDMTDGEAEVLRGLLVASARPYLHGVGAELSYALLKEALDAKWSTMAPQDRLARIDALLAMRPLELNLMKKRAIELARMERWREAIDAFRGYSGEAGVRIDDVFSQRAMMALLSGDEAEYGRLVEAVNEAFTSSDQVLRTQILALDPRAGVDFRALRDEIIRLSWGRGSYGPHYYALIGLLQLREGDLVEAERQARAAVATKWSVELDQVPARAILALVLAKKGDRAGALREWRAGEAEFGREVSDGELVGGDLTIGKRQMSSWWSSMYAVLRRELRATLGESHP